MKAKLINKALAWLMTLTMVVSMLPASVFAAGSNVAKVGDTEYATIDEAIANWTNGTTLTLLADVTLSDVIKLNSTEYHILDLGTHTMTAASGKNAVVIQACGTGSAERSAITINADATNPGGINAGKKCVVYYKYADGGISTEDRPIIKINGGVFTGSTSSFGTAGIHTIGTAARKCATVNITGGIFNCSIVGSSKSKLIISGGTFNSTVSSQGDSTALRLISGGTFKTLGFMTADSNNTKFWIGTSMGNSNVGAYVDDNGYIVIGGPVVTEAGEAFEAAASYSGASSYLQYSSAKDNGLYYTSVEEAFADNNTTAGSVTVYVDKLDMTDIDYKGTIVVPEGESLTIVTEAGTTPAWSVSEGADVTYVDAATGEELVRGDNGTFESAAPTVTYVAEISGVGYPTLSEAMGAAKDGDTVTLLGDLAIDTETYTISDGVSVTLDMNGKKLTVTDSMTSGNYELFYIYGKLTVTGDGTIELTSTTDRDWNAMSAIFHNRGGELTIENGTFKNLGGTDMAWVVDNSGNHFGDAVTNVDGGMLESSYTAIRNRMEENSHGASGKATVNVSGGTINGVTSAIWAQAASMSTTSPATGAINVTGGEVGLINTARSAGAECMTTISGGTVNGFKGEVGELTVKGGTLTGDVTILTAEGETANYTITNEGLYAPASYVAKINGVGYATLSEAVVAAQAGDTIVLLSDAVLEDTLTIEKSITLDGAGYTLIPADASKTYNSAIMAGNSGWGDDHGETITLNNLVFDGWNTNYGAVRAQGVTLNMDGCEFTNCSASSAAYAVLSLNYTDATISNTAFVDNGSRAVDINYNGDSSNALVTIDGCTFEDNTTTGAGIVMRSAGKIAVKNSTFVGNTVNTNGNAATLYVGFGAGNEVSGCVFEDNTITTSHTTTKRFATAIFCDGCDVTGNVFGEGNTATRNGENITTTVAVGAYYGPANVSGNYWQGEEPVLGEDYAIEYTRNEVTIDSYYTDYTIDADGNVVLENKVEITDNVAKIGDVEYATFAEAVAAAKDGDTIVLLTDVEVSEPIVLQKSTTLDGNDKTIKAAADFSGYSAFMLGDSGVNFDAAIAMTIKSATFTGFEVSHGVLRIEGVTANIVGCTFTGNKQTKSGYGVVSYDAAAGTVSGCTFTANTCFEVLDINSQPGGSYVYSADEVFTVKNNLFADNMVNSTAVIYYCNGSGSAITGNTFTGNTVKSDSHAAILYYSLGTDCAVTGNVFSGNTIVASGARAGVLVLEAGTVASQNVFTLNNISSTAGGTTYVATVVNKADADTAGVTINENYWGGSEPDYVSAKGAPTTAENYFASYEAGQLGGYTELAVTVVANNQAELQAALDNCKANTTIQLVAGANYGVVYMRPTPTNPATKSVDWIGNNYGYESYTCFDGLTILGADGATIDAIKIEGGTYYHTEHSQSATYPVMQSLVELKDVTIDGVTFTGKGGYDPQGYGNALNFSGNNIKVNGLTLRNCVLANADNNARLMYKTESTTFVHRYTYNGVEYTFVPNLKDITVTDCTFNGGYMGMELRETENLTVTNNTFNGVASRDILLPANSGCTYTGTITITGNTSNGAGDRFVRGQGIGDATLIIADNAIVNYKGGDSDFIKVNDATGTVIISDNTFEGKEVAAVEENGVWIVVASANYLAEVDGVGYATLAEAVAAADGKTVTLLDNIELTATVKILEGKTVTLDLNGKTIDGTGNVRIALMSYGNLTIKDSSAEQNGVVKAGIGTAGNAVNICAGTFTMESGSIYSLNNAILIDEQAAVINIVGGTITAEPATKNSAVMYVSSTSATEINITGGEMVGYNGILLWNNTTINMTSGSIVAQGSTGIQGNGTKDNTKINISGNASVVGYYSAIYHPQNGELNISENAVLSGWTGVVVKSGKVTISGGTINGTGAADTYRPVSSGYVDTGDALYVEHYDNSTNSENYGTPVVTVTGGTFNSANGSPIASYANANNAANGVAALERFVSGGTFNKEPTAELAAEGYEFAANDNGTYGVVEAVTELFTLAGITTSLDSSLALNIYYTPLTGATATDYYAIVAHQKENTISETTIPFADWGTSGNKKLIRYTGLAAKEMADELTVTIYDANGNAVSKSFTTSFRAYAIGMMSSGQYDPVKHRVWFTALTDMLNYGAAAQQMFGYKTDNLANAGTDKFQQYASAEYTLSTDGFSMSGTAWAPSLTLESTILLNFYFNDVTEGMYATYSYTTHAGTSVSATVDYNSFVNGWGHSGVAVPIAIADAGTPVTVTMSNADGSAAGAMTCSANNYLKGMTENNPDVALYPALAKFAASAKEAFSN